MVRRALIKVGLVAGIGALLVAGLPSTAGSATRAKWNTRVFASVPSPGFPAYVFRHTNGRVYAATYKGPGASPKTDRVFEWTASGTLLRSWAVPGQIAAKDPGVQVANQDARGRLVLLETSTSSVLTLDTKTGRFTRQAVLPDLPTCKKAKGKPCSPNASDEPAIPNYATWGPDGALYVTDYGQAVIWRIPAGGGRPTIWFASTALDYIEFGTTGITYDAPRRSFLIAQQTTGDLLGGGLAGRLYRLPVTADGRPGALATIWKAKGIELPDGFGVARSGRIYLANLLSNQLVVLTSAGKEIERFPTSKSGKNGSKVPFDGPSNATFAGTRVLVANQSPVAGDRTHHVILDVEVGEPGAAPFIPKKSRLR